MKSLSRILGCVGVATLCIAACNDKDISLIVGDGGSGGSSGGNGGSAGAGTAGQGGSSQAGNGGLGGGGAGGSPSAGSAGMSSAGAAGSGADCPDGGPDCPDSGTPVRSDADICADYCARRIAFANATSDGGPNCAGFNSGGTCQQDCLDERAFYESISCAPHKAMIECFIVADAWICDTSGDPAVYENSSPTCDAEVAAMASCN